MDEKQQEIRSSAMREAAPYIDDDGFTARRGCSNCRRRGEAWIRYALSSSRKHLASRARWHTFVDGGRFLVVANGTFDRIADFMVLASPFVQRPIIYGRWRRCRISEGNRNCDLRSHKVRAPPNIEARSAGQALPVCLNFRSGLR